MTSFRLGEGGCSLFCFYIKPQPTTSIGVGDVSCSLFCFYIKPQLGAPYIDPERVVPYFVSTSNHNCSHAHNLHKRLFLILFLHQTTTPVSLLDNSQEVTAVQRRTKWVPSCLRSVFDAILLILPMQMY